MSIPLEEAVEVLKDLSVEGFVAEIEGKYKIRDH